MMVEQVSDILTEELGKLKEDIIKRHEGAGQVASGKTRASFEDYLTSERSGVLEGAGYAGVLERGRKPGKVPYDFKDILQRWAVAKGLTFESQSDFNRWAYFVSKKIREEGTELYRSGKQEDIFTTPIRNFENNLSERIAAFYETEIENNLFTR